MKKIFRAQNLKVIAHERPNWALLPSNSNQTLSNKSQRVPSNKSLKRMKLVKQKIRKEMMG